MQNKMSAADDGHDRVTRLLVTDYMLLVMTIVVVICRWFSKLQRLGRVCSDDYCIIAATLLLVFLIILQTAMTSYGFGYPTASLPLATLQIQAFLGSIARLVYTPASSLIRISVLLFVRKLSVHSWIHYTTMGLITANVMYAIIPVFILTFQCWPISASFQASMLRRSATCIDPRTLGLAIPLVSLLLDIVVWLVPVILVVRVRSLCWRKKLLAMVLLGMGVLACGASLMRLPAGGRLGARKDPSRYIITLSMWTSVELSMGIIAASAPALWPLLVVCTRRCTTSWTPSMTFWSSGEPRMPGSLDEEMADVVEVEPQQEARMVIKFDSTEALFNYAVERLAGDEERDEV